MRVRLKIKKNLLMKNCWDIIKRQLIYGEKNIHKATTIRYKFDVYLKNTRMKINNRIISLSLENSLIKVTSFTHDKNICDDKESITKLRNNFSYMIKRDSAYTFSICFLLLKEYHKDSDILKIVEYIRVNFDN